MTNPADFIPIDATVGSALERSASAAFYLFWIPKKEDNAPRAEIGIDTAVRFATLIRKEFGKTVNAFVDRDQEVGGSWSDNRYSVEPGTVLKIWGEKTAWGTVAGKAALILLCNKDAPVNRVTMEISPLPTAAKSAVTITGQFWVLNRDTVKDHTGIPPLTKQAEHYSSPIFINEVFKITECIPAPEKAMAIKSNVKEVDTGSRILAAGTHAGGIVTLRTLKGKRVMG